MELAQSCIQWWAFRSAIRELVMYKLHKERSKCKVVPVLN